MTIKSKQTFPNYLSEKSSIKITHTFSNLYSEVKGTTIEKFTWPVK